MIYTIIVLIVIALLITLTVLAGKKKSHSKLFFFINLSLSIIGIALLISSYLVGINAINSLDAESDFYSWARDFFDMYYKLSMFPFVFLLIINLIASVLGLYVPKYQTPISVILRCTVSVFSSVLLLLIPYYGYFTINDTIPLLTYMTLSGIGQALTIRLASAVDPINKFRMNRGKL